MTDPRSEQTKPETEKFDFSAYPANTLFFDRRSGQDRRDSEPESDRPRERRQKERRRRICPTTFEKQYTPDELEFMNAMQKFKNHSGKTFPTVGEVLEVALKLGYRKVAPPDPCPPDINGRHPHEGPTGVV